MQKKIQEQHTQDLQISSSNTLALVKTAKAADLLKCKTIATQIIEAGPNTVLTEIRVYVEKCAFALNIKMSDIQVLTLCEDLVDVYTYESIEDIRECLKKGRTGLYGFGMNNRNSLNMILIREWMQQHLEQKVIERERLHQQKKAKAKAIIEDVDYNAYKERIKKEAEKKGELTDKEKEYRDYKAKFLAEQQTKTE